MFSKLLFYYPRTCETLLFFLCRATHYHFVRRTNLFWSFISINILRFPKLSYFVQRGYCNCRRYGFKSFILFINVWSRINGHKYSQVSIIISVSQESTLTTTTPSAVQKPSKVVPLHNLLLHNLLFFCTCISIIHCWFFKTIDE